MKALQLVETGAPLKLHDVPAPELRPGSVLVRMQAAPVLSYMKHVVSGALGYRMPVPPFTIGTNGVGVIDAVAPDVFGLAPGTRVALDPRIAVHENVPEPDEILIGLTAMSPQSERLQAIWRDGVFAELALMPAECVTPIPGLDDLPAARACCLGKFTVAYGGLHRGGLRAGETIVVNGATGSLGSGAVLLAVAMGAVKVVALGRDAATLDRLAAAAGPRVAPVSLGGDRAADAARILAAAGGPPAMALDLVGQAGDGQATLAALDSLAPGGRLVLMGSMTVPLEIDYGAVMRRNIDIRGAFMYPRQTQARLADLVAAGLLDLDAVELWDFPLARYDEAIEQATQIRGLQYCVLTMP